MIFLTPQNFPDYELIDCGDFEKLERFGQYLTIRPEPQAVWAKKIPQAEWEKMAHVRFVQKGSSAGDWKKLKKMPDKWKMQYQIQSLSCAPTLSFYLSLISFKHIGIFPEQAVNWDYAFNSISEIRASAPTEKKGGVTPRVLNLFAHTGAASLAAKAAGAEVTHLDSVKQVVSWARENMELSQLTDIRWIVEDALKFVKREVKRGNRYHGIILDPPAYGIGTNGEKWKLEENIQEMMENVLRLLVEDKHFLILNAYSLGFSSLIIENLLKDFAHDNLQTGELFLSSKSGLKLPLGVFGRFKNF